MITVLALAAPAFAGFWPVDDGTVEPWFQTKNGIGYQDLVQGTGPTAISGAEVEVHYTGMLLDGSVFDRSRDRGLPVRFRIGAGTVIRGWEEGMIGMRVGGQRRMAIPPDAAYGRAGRGELIPPHATLHLEVELVVLRDDPPPD